MKMVLPSRRTLRGVAASTGVAAGLAALIAGCGSSASTTASVTSSKSIAQIPANSILRAADLSSAATGYKVALTEHVTGASTSVDATATGSYTPASHEADLTMSVTLPASEGGATQLQIVLDQGTIYVHLPASMASEFPAGKAWLSITLDQVGKLDGVPGLGSLVNESSSLDNPTEYLDFLRATADGTVKNLGQETVNGVQTTHYRAEVDFAKLPDAVPAADRATMQQLVDNLGKKVQVPEFPVDVWIDSANLVRRLQENLTETVSGNPVTVAITEDFLEYGPQPAPTVPSPDQTLNLLSLLHGS